MPDISNFELEQYEKLKAQKKKQLEYQNDYVRTHYKRVSLNIKPDLYKNICAVYGDDIKLQTYITGLIEKDLRNKKPLDFGECPF